MMMTYDMYIVLNRTYWFWFWFHWAVGVYLIYVALFILSGALFAWFVKRVML